MKKAIVVDIDGVILNTSDLLKDIQKFHLQGDEMWSYFYKHCNSKLYPPIKSTLQFLKDLSEYSIILSTARNEACQEDTIQRLTSEGLKFDLLLMRGHYDRRPSPDVKKDHLKSVIRNYQIVAFIDDDPQNCLMAKEMGILALQKV